MESENLDKKAVIYTSSFLLGRNNFKYVIFLQILRSNNDALLARGSKGKDRFQNSLKIPKN